MLKTFYLKHIPIEIKRSKRRQTVGFKVAKGKVSVTAPDDLDDQTLTTLINQKARWIESKYVEMQSYQAPAAKRYENDEKFVLLDREYRLKLFTAKQSMVWTHNDHLIVCIPPSVRYVQRYIKNALETWYKQQALEILQERVRHYSVAVGASPRAVKVKTFKRRWGSCTSQREITFNWQIVIAPSSIVDYVVVHELCHLQHLNHSRAFWQLVTEVMPNYREAELWLKQYGDQLFV